MILLKGKTWGFHRVPKTGSTALCEAIQARYARGPVLCFNHATPIVDVAVGGALMLPEHDKVRQDVEVAGVFRDPFDWAVSMWRHLERRGWENTGWHGIEAARDQTLYGFILNLVEHQPGWVSRLYRTFRTTTDVVIPYEYMVDGINEFLAGHNEAPLKFEMVNVGEGYHLDMERAKGLRTLFQQSEPYATDVHQCALEAFWK